MHDYLMFDVLLLGKSVAQFKTIYTNCVTSCCFSASGVSAWLLHLLGTTYGLSRRSDSRAQHWFPSLHANYLETNATFRRWTCITRRFEKTTPPMFGAILSGWCYNFARCGTKKSWTGWPHSFSYLCFAGDEALTLLETAYFQCPCNAIPRWWSLRFIQLDFCSRFLVIVITGKSSK